MDCYHVTINEALPFSLRVQRRQYCPHKLPRPRICALPCIVFKDYIILSINFLLAVLVRLMRKDQRYLFVHVSHMLGRFPVALKFTWSTQYKKEIRYNTKKFFSMNKCNFICHVRICKLINLSMRFGAFIC